MAGLAAGDSASTVRGLGYQQAWSSVINSDNQPPLRLICATGAGLRLGLLHSQRLRFQQECIFLVDKS